MKIKLSRVACISSVLLAFLPAIGQNAPSIATAKSTAAPTSVPKLPIPSGKYGIGRAGFDWTDAKRRDLLDP